MTSYDLFLSSATVRALGWTLVHSLWQGTALALLLFVSLPRMRGARRRYWLGFGALLAQFAAAVVTFALVYAPSPTPSVALPSGVAPDVTLLPVAAAPIAEGLFALDAWLEPYLPVVSACWAIGLLVSVLRLGGGFHFLYRLRRYSLPVQETHWQRRASEFARALGLARPVRLLESALVHMPMTMGFIKPVILLPVGLVNHLSPAEVEAVLAHELAHIARRDWLFNLVQACLEAVFYFHPAIWWIGSVVRRERENCCDDAAVALTGSAIAYARTLVRLQERSRSIPTPALALGLGGHVASTLLKRRRKPGFGLLLGRVQRILNQTQPSATSPMEKAIATILLLALLSLWTVRSDSAPQLKAAVLDAAAYPFEWIGIAAPVPPTPAQIGADTLPPGARKGRVNITHHDDDQRVELELENDQVTRLKIDGREIPASEYGNYRELVDELRNTEPPLPPDPPALPGLPAVPGAPAKPGMPAALPGVPAPPLGATSRIITEKDADGNTVLRIEGAGNGTQLVVKDGEVWMDGRKLDAGETIAIAGDAPSFYGRHEGTFLRSFDQELLREFNAADVERIQRETEQAMEAHYRESGNMRGLSDEDRKRVEKELKHVEKELKRAHKEMEKALKKSAKTGDNEWNEWQKDFDRQMAEHARAMARHEVDMARHHVEMERHNQVMTAIRRQLLADKLIKNESSYSLKLSAGELRVNGKKQPDDVRQRYLDLYKKETGQELQGTIEVNNREEN